VLHPTRPVCEVIGCNRKGYHVRSLENIWEPHTPQLCPEHRKEARIAKKQGREVYHAWLMRHICY